MYICINSTRIAYHQNSLRVFLFYIMPKTCNQSDCNNPVFSNKYCLNHQNKRTDPKWLARLEKINNPSKSLKTPTKRKSIKPVSDKQLLKLKQYRKLRDTYMGIHTTCEVKGCNNPSSDLHHIKSREFYLCDTNVFMSVCRNCHRKIHDNDSWARENGYLLSSI